MRPNLAVLRSAIGPMLTEQGTVKRQTGQYEQDPDTGLEEPIYATTYTGPMLVRPEDRSMRVADIGGSSYTVLRFDVTLPADADALVGDRLTVTSCPGDPTLVGETLRLIDVPRDAWQVARFAVAERI
ncbi:MAG TPA: DUF6093 family protein [Nocardioides sp.]|uniref:DUF6093 family protein n=1 Tax=Nocardioides sp. TaxID=35761 RepID=UPI002EDA8395